MLRYPATFFLTLFFLMGTGPFDRVHAQEVQRELDAIPVPRLAGGLPLKKLPQRCPVHDPATCAVCIAIHSPATVYFSPDATVCLLAFAGRITIDSPTSVARVIFLTEQSRAPPAI